MVHVNLTLHLPGAAPLTSHDDDHNNLASGSGRYYLAQDCPRNKPCHKYLYYYEYYFQLLCMKNTRIFKYIYKTVVNKIFN